MSIYTLDTDLVVQSGDAQWQVQRVLDDQYVQLENLSTGRIRRERIGKLASDITSQKLTVVRDSGSVPSGEKRAPTQMVVCTATLPPKHKKKFERAYDYVKQMRKRGITKGQRTRISAAISSVAQRSCDGCASTCRVEAIPPFWYLAIRIDIRLAEHRARSWRSLGKPWPAFTSCGTAARCAKRMTRCSAS